MINPHARTVALASLPLLISLTLPHQSLAQPASDPAALVARHLSEGEALEQFVAQVMTSMRQADIGGDGLDRADVDLQLQFRSAAARAQNVAQVMRYDLSGDMIVTTDEVAAFNGASRQDAGYNDLERFDVDGNGRVTLQEVVEASARISKVDRANTAYEPESLLQLPEARDGKLTADELEIIARGAFAKVDLDQDGRISKTEMQSFRASQPSKPRAEPVRDVYCAMPLAEKGDLIVLYSAYEGVKPRASGPQAAGTATINIEPGRQSIYLILPSYSAIRWQITGATARVRQVVVSSYEQGSPDRPRGVDGLPKDKIRVFNSGGCIPQFGTDSSPDISVANAAVSLRLGRPADVAAAQYTAKEVALPSNSDTSKVAS